MEKLTENSLAEENCPDPDQVLHRFNEIIICEELEIPEEKPDKERIADTVIKPNVSDLEVIDVDLGDTERRKVAAFGDLNIGIEYSALNETQQIHFANFNIPFQGIIGYRPCIDDPEDENYNRGLLLDCFDINDFNINTCVEYQQFEQIDERTIKAVVVLLVWLEPQETTITITEPEDGAVIEGTIDISAVVSNGIDLEDEVLFEYSDDDGETWIEIGIDDEPVNGTFTVEWDTTEVADGEYLIRVSAQPVCPYPDIDILDSIVVTVANENNEING